jgi:2-oxoglutarate dehydrogenase complex dehydrogenase (E1) component-like enzyme
MDVGNTIQLYISIFTLLGLFASGIGIFIAFKKTTVRKPVGSNEIDKFAMAMNDIKTVIDKQTEMINLMRESALKAEIIHTEKHGCTVNEINKHTIGIEHLGEQVVNLQEEHDKLEELVLEKYEKLDMRFEQLHRELIKAIEVLNTNFINMLNYKKGQPND